MWCSAADKIEKRLLGLESICNVYNDESLYKPVIATLSGDVAAIKTQLMKLQQNDHIAEYVHIYKPETDHVNKNLKDSKENFEANIELLKSQLKRLHDDMNIKINNKSKEQRDELNKYIQAITKDAHATPSTREQMRSLAEYIAASSSENKSELLKLQLKMVESNQKTVGTIQELKSFVEIVNENKISADKYLRLKNMILKLNENSVTKEYVDESVKQKLTIEASELNKLSTKLQHLETKSNEIQSFVDAMATLSDPEVKKDYDSQLILVKTMQKEIVLQKKTLQEKIKKWTKV